MPVSPNATCGATRMSASPNAASSGDAAGIPPVGAGLQSATNVIGGDRQDDSLETHLGIWRQPDTGSPFVRLESTVQRASQDVRASLPGFSRYAIAY